MRTPAIALSHYVVAPHRGPGPHQLVDTGDVVRTTISGIPSPASTNKRHMAKLICPALDCAAWATADDTEMLDEIAAAVPVVPEVHFQLTR